MKNINDKKFNPFKYIVNVDILEAYMIVHDLTKEEFCKLCEIDLKFLNTIIERKLTWIPYKIFEISEIIKEPFSRLINFELVRKYKIILFENDVFRI